MKRWRVMVNTWHTELSENQDQAAKASGINYRNNTWGPFSKNDPRIYVTAQDELGAWMQAKKWFEENKEQLDDLS